MFDKMKQLMELKKQADQLKKELEAVVLEVNDVRGIKLVINGSQEIKSIQIDPSLLNEGNKARLEGDLLKSFNSAVKKAQMTAAKKMQNLLPQGFPGI